MMKRLLGIALTFAVGVGTLLSIGSRVEAAPPGGYPMTCKTGPSNQLSIGGIFTGVPTLIFTRSSGPVASGLEPGQCAFGDRAVRANEPTAICLKSSTTFPITELLLGDGKITLNGDGTPAGNIADAVAKGSSKIFNFNVDDPQTFFGHVCFKVLSYSP